MYCYKHKNTETSLRCGNCDRPMCVRCVVQHPVGIRCPDCARSRRIPVFDVSPVFYARAVAAAVGIGVSGAIGLFFLDILLIDLGFPRFYIRWLLLLALVSVSYLMGTGVNWAVSRKRSRGLQWITGVGVAVIFVATLGPALTDLFGLLALAGAVYVAVNQLRV
ncbi:MAG: hypothetical protein V3S37_07095 [Dehalococcoidia bacterium]